MTLGERIKKARRSLDLTQQKFADQIGTTQNNIASYEIGRREPSAAAINNICKTFNISEEWLRTGAGEMFVQREPQPLEDLLTQLIKGRDITGADRILVKNFLELPESSRQEVITFISKCAQELTEAGQDQPAPAVQAWAPADADGQDRTGTDTGGGTRPRYHVPTDEDIEREVEDFRRRLLLEKKQADRPSPSSEGGETA